MPERETKSGGGAPTVCGIGLPFNGPLFAGHVFYRFYYLTSSYWCSNEIINRLIISLFFYYYYNYAIHKRLSISCEWVDLAYGQGKVPVKWIQDQKYSFRCRHVPCLTVRPWCHYQNNLSSQVVVLWRNQKSVSLWKLLRMDDRVKQTYIPQQHKHCFLQYWFHLIIRSIFALLYLYFLCFWNLLFCVLLLFCILLMEPGTERGVGVSVCCLSLPQKKAFMREGEK